MRRFAISLEWAHQTAAGFYAAGKTDAEFRSFVAANYHGFSARRMLTAWERL